MLARKLKYYGYRIAPRPTAAVHRYLQRWIRARRNRRAIDSSGLQTTGTIDPLDQAKMLAVLIWIR